MQTRMPHRIFQFAALALAVVWLAGPLGTFAGAVLNPAHAQCHCPGHANHEPAPPGPAFSPCDHDASANLASDRWVPTPGNDADFVTETIATLAERSVSIPEGRLPLPEAPPPKHNA